MKMCLILMATVTATALAGDSFRLGAPVFVGETDYTMSYDDGTPYWLTWGGQYRGVWFDIDDFQPWASSNVEMAEFWFYHSSGYGAQWDTSSFYAELWNGSVGGPASMLDQTSVIALHNTATFLRYSPSIDAEYHFWSIVNTSFSSGGWPSSLGDNTPNTVNHSFYSDDFIIWEPWTIQGPMANDYLIRMYVTGMGLNAESWGSIKGLFR